MREQELLMSDLFCMLFHSAWEYGRQCFNGSMPVNRCASEAKYICLWCACYHMSERDTHTDTGSGYLHHCGPPQNAVVLIRRQATVNARISIFPFGYLLCVHSIFSAIYPCCRMDNTQAIYIYLHSFPALHSLCTLHSALHNSSHLTWKRNDKGEINTTYI